MDWTGYLHVCGDVMGFLCIVESDLAYTYTKISRSSASEAVSKDHGTILRLSPKIFNVPMLHIRV